MRTKWHRFAILTWGHVLCWSISSTLLKVHTFIGDILWSFTWCLLEQPSERQCLKHTTILQSMAQCSDTARTQPVIQSAIMTQEFSPSKWESLKLLRIWCSPQYVVGIGAEPITFLYSTFSYSTWVYVLAHICAVFVLVLFSSLLYSSVCCLYLFLMFNNSYLLLVLFFSLLWVLLLLLFVIRLITTLGDTPRLHAEVEALRNRQLVGSDRKMLSECWDSLF